MVFHRFLIDRPGQDKLTISVNGEKLRAWNPFAPDEPATVQLPPQRFELQHGGVTGSVELNRYILPSRERFSSPSAFERMTGPMKWNRQQGLYYTGRTDWFNGVAGQVFEPSTNTQSLSRQPRL